MTSRRGLEVSRRASAPEYFWAAQGLYWFSAVEPGEFEFEHLQSFSVASDATFDARYSDSSGAVAAIRTVFLSDLASSTLRFVRPLPVQLHFSDNVVAAYSYDLDELGVGVTEEEALSDLRAALVETYLLLEAECDNLGPIQSRHWAFMSDAVQRK